jgi:DNA polymerase-3 subunit epsilon
MFPGEIIVFDVETTGTDRQRDQVIELCVQMGLDAGAERMTWRMRPSVPISRGAQEVHGISMDDLAHCPPFGAYADQIRALFARARVLVGYNMSFDIEMLQAEYARLRQPLLALDGKQFVDAYRLWQQCEPRSLQHAHQRFVGDSFEDAHSAGADVAATGRVLRGMIRDFGLMDRDWDAIARVCEPERSAWVGPSRHIRWEQGVVVIGFGKHAGKPVHVLAGSDDRGYLEWILGKDFPRHVHAICRAALELGADEFGRWVAQAFAGGGGAAGPERPVRVMSQPGGMRRAVGQ